MAVSQSVLLASSTQMYGVKVYLTQYDTHTAELSDLVRFLGSVCECDESTCTVVKATVPDRCAQPKKKEPRLRVSGSSCTTQCCHDIHGA